jgi:hypothetical protein
MTHTHPTSPLVAQSLRGPVLWGLLLAALSCLAAWILVARANRSDVSRHRSLHVRVVTEDGGVGPRAHTGPELRLPAARNRLRSDMTRRHAGEAG